MNGPQASAGALTKERVWHASRAKDRCWAVEALAPPKRREGVEEVVESVGRAARDALDHARRAKEAVTRARRR